MMSECEGITEEQLKTTNGCGSSFWLAYIFRIPKWFSKSFWCACNCHDLGYQDTSKTSLLDKYQLDDKLYDAMYYSAYHGLGWLKEIKIIVADTTYWCLGTWLSDLCWLMAKKNRR